MLVSARTILIRRNPVEEALLIGSSCSSLIGRTSLSSVKGTNQRSTCGSRNAFSIRAFYSNSSCSGEGSRGATTLTAVVTVRRKRKPGIKERLLDHVDGLSDSAGQRIMLQLISVEIDPKTNKAKRSDAACLRDWSQKASLVADKVQYIAQFTVPQGFGVPGAIAVVNNHQNEFFLETIVVRGMLRSSAKKSAETQVTTTASKAVYFSCYSWVQSKFNDPKERVFFSNEVYLPWQTPAGLRDLRDEEKASLRGNGFGIRKQWERVYDYAPYNDTGNPDQSPELSRPTLGGHGNMPYPRRCRTGRLPTQADANAESVLPMGLNYYVPRDEAFEETKQETFIGDSLKGAIHQLVPSVLNSLNETREEGFRRLHDIDNLYHQPVEPSTSSGGLLKHIPILDGIEQQVRSSANELSKTLQYTKPAILSSDPYAWLRDAEFGRQVLAGVNPVNIQRLKEFPPRSFLDPNVYGPSLSAITEEHLLRGTEGLSVKEAMDAGRMFLLDYHDAYMPFVERVNKLEGRKMYATRTIFFRTQEGTLVPLAIELSLPRGQRRVFTPAHSEEGTAFWEWQMAKAHVSSNDAGFHQLVNHWLRSHASVEPYAIATHRQLSVMHPIAKLLRPHFRYTLEINASARQLLINADGVIENCFTPGPFSLEISSAAYASMWRFDEALPSDLIRRGMAIEDESQPHGLNLLVEDYPYAADGLLIWESIVSWVDEYVSLYYDDEDQERSILNDIELQAWWDEIRTRGHEDKKDEDWWPQLNTSRDLKSILATIIWVVSGFHAAINFGQYAYGGYVPNRPCLTRRLIPEEGSPDYVDFVKDPERFFMSCLPNHQQATTTMAVVDTLSSHSPDEEYLGQRTHTNWTCDPRALEASRRFNTSMQHIETIIQQRNSDFKLKNRHGAGVLPYEFLLPSSGPCLTRRGVPNSISI